jgi:hypothetical protein
MSDYILFLDPPIVLGFYLESWGIESLVDLVLPYFVVVFMG